MMELRPYQIEAVEAIFHEWNENNVRSTLLVLPTGCHAKGETLLMYDGSIKKVENIKLNEQIMGPDGTPRTVLHIQEGIDELYRISPDNAASFVVTKDHKLTLLKDGKNPELIDITVLDYLKLTPKKKEKLRLVSCNEIKDFNSYYSTLNLVVSPFTYGELISNSLIPNEYKLNTKEVRLELLKGLLKNKDCWNNKGGFYRTKSEQLANDIVFLCKSLNINAFVKTEEQNKKTYYKVYITENSAVLNKKCFEKYETIPQLTYSFTVEPHGTGEYVGFTVDKDNRYVMSNFLITHNCGKTIVFANVAKQAVDNGKKVLILAHRGELLEQAQDKLKKAVDIDTELEKGTSHADKSAQVIVASVQTLYQDNRLTQYSPDEFDYIICDEAHHALSDTYKKIFEYFSSAKILGVTATPDRGDMKSLGEVFESKAYEYNMRDAIENGYLSPITVQTLPIKIDISNVKMQTGDFSAGELGTALDPYLEVIADKIVEEAFGRKIMIFVPLVKTGEKVARMLNERGLRCTNISGQSKDRNKIIEEYGNNKYNCIVNSLLLCVDKDTEILTDKGFVSVQKITKSDRIANWNFDNTIFFKEPKSVISRELSPDEYMVSVNSRTVNFRVTNKHNMIVYDKYNDTYKKILAEDVNYHTVFPACGVSLPESKQHYRKIEYTPTKREISYTKYNLVHREGYLPENAETEAKRRLCRKHNMQYLNPSELTIAQCKFIGFWIADGSVQSLIKSGMEYKLSQSSIYPKIIEWIDNTLQECNIDYIKRYKTKTSRNNINPYYDYSLPRGTGGGSQQRNGIYELEPYLDKNGNELFWELNEAQFDAILEGYWYGDGFHGKAENGFPQSIRFRDTNKKWIELLCAIGSTKGWKCTIHERNFKKYNNKYNNQYELLMKKNKMVYTSTKTIINHEQYFPETVYCVTTDSGNIITRRNGIVMVMGNCEGYDEPSVDCIVNLRATKSASLYRQILGRGTRLFEGKTNLLILDFLWQTKRHDLFKPANLLCQNPEVAEKMTEIINENEGPVDLFEAEVEAAEEIRRKKEEEIRKREEALIKRLKESRERQQAHQTKKGHFRSVQFTEQSENPNIEYFYDENDNLDSVVVYNDTLLFLSTKTNDLTRFEPSFVWEMQPITDKQKEILMNNGIDPILIQFKGFACKIIDVLFSRREKGLCTIKQGMFLKKKKFLHTNEWTFEQASKMMDLIVKCHWCVPKNINPMTYVPK